ncbi:zeta toxin family protein [Streptomyces sp. LUP30]|uniref:zeta toxin family protein n=1 Tax=Streptomyces sp. LUP30 TaxID=1890285 RepID=UPI000851960B|nr:zeta toxin family protein [Streptomyces sp. LUP30]
MARSDNESAILSEQESLEALDRVILPAATRQAVHQLRPVVVVVAGQPGAGKTTLADRVAAVLARRGGAVRVGRDLYKPLHRHYAGVLEADVRTAGALVRPDTARWQAAVEAHVREMGFDAVVESALADPDDFRASSRAYRAAGHRIEVVVLAISEALSQLGIVDRFLTEAADGGGRYVSWENHDTCAKGLLATLAVIEAEQLADRVTVVRRDGTALYTNDLTPEGTWRCRPAAERVLRAERARPWTAPETAVFRHALAHTDRRVHTELADEDRRLAVQRDSERAAAWSEPVRRIAQPTTTPPGVAYHRLSADEHRWIFDELITPTVLAGVTRRDDPRAVYVLGQPGAGKLLAARMVRRAMRTGTTRLVGDDFKASHPDYFQLLRDDPRSAGAAIRTDYRAWFSRAEEYVRSHRGDVLIEAAPGSVAEFLDSALPFATDGYPVELVVLAVRAADSRLATALRYARALQIGGTGRFTTRSGHDTCFQALADIVAVAERHPQIAAITVIRRDGQALLRHEADGSGRASWALAAERLRPYTEQEAMAFLQLHQALRRALPRHRGELDEIAALARPLMPPRMQPASIDRPHPSVWPLPVRQHASGYDSLSSLSRAA